MNDERDGPDHERQADPYRDGEPQVSDGSALSTSNRWHSPLWLYRRRTLLSFVASMGLLTLFGIVSAATSGWMLTLLGAVLAVLATAGFVAPPGEDDRVGYKATCVGVGATLGALAGLVPLAAGGTEDGCPDPGEVPSQLALGEVLASGQSLTSPSERFVLTMEHDGQLAFCDNKGDVRLWDILTNDYPQAYAALERNGNFVIRSRAGEFLWASNTDNTDVRALVVEDSGRIALLAPDSPPLWASDGVAPVMEADRPRVPHELSKWEALRPGEELRSPNGKYRLVMRSDGDLVLYDGQDILWSTETAGNYGAALAMQQDGNLVLYAEPSNPDPSKQTALWASNTDGSGALKLRLGDDGSLTLWGLDGVVPEESLPNTS